MTLSSQPLPALGQPNSTEDSKIRSLLSELQGIVNGGIDSSNITDGSIAEVDLASALAARLGVGTGGRGKTNIATSQTTSSPTYATLGTPDSVTITLPTDGLIVVGYQATWQESVNSAARAALFIGANQVQVAISGGNSVTEASLNQGSGAVDAVLGTDPTRGLVGNWAGSAYAASPATTGQLLGAQPTGSNRGGPCYIFAAAGTYAVSVQFKVSSGSVTVKDRHLWAWTVGF
jgi:hypothetical protein